MRKTFFLLFFILLISLSLFLKFKNASIGGAPPYVFEDLNPPPEDRFAWLDAWKRPDGPPRVGLQAGHWKNNELPEELDRLKGSTGSSGGGKSEWEVNLEIAQKTKIILEEKGIQVDILPATVPPKYWADIFVSIHADGSLDPKTSGFKIASPRRDYSGKAEKLVNLMEENYRQATNLAKDPNITRNMRGYYAFAWWRYDHSVHPKSASVIVETGFLTSQQDRRLLIGNPVKAAEGIASGIIKFLESENLLEIGS